jgi:hypothetical protein
MRVLVGIVLVCQICSLASAADVYCKPDSSKTSGCNLAFCGRCCRTVATTDVRYEKFGVSFDRGSSRPIIDCGTGMTFRDFNTNPSENSDNYYHWRSKDWLGRDQYVRDTAFCEGLSALARPRTHSYVHSEQLCDLQQWRLHLVHGLQPWFLSLHRALRRKQFVPAFEPCNMFDYSL